MSGTSARISAAFKDRDFEPLVPPIKFLPQRYSWSTIGGPRQAELEGTGDQDALWQCIDLLRCEVVLTDENAKDVWWGYVAEVQINTGVYSFGISLDSMANRIAVAYTRIEAGGTTSSNRATTLWATNNDSAAEFGIKEAMLTMANATDSAADRFRDAALSLGYLPVPTFNIAEGSQPRVTIICRGWWDTLRWRYPALLPDGFTKIPNGTTTYDNLALIKSGVPPNSPGYNSNSMGYKIAQSFKTGSYGYRLDSVELKVSRNGTPQPLKVGVYSANQASVDPVTQPGQPGSPIGGYGLIDQSQVAEGEANWIEVGVGVGLEPNKWYWLVVEGAAAESAYAGEDTWNLGSIYTSTTYPADYGAKMYPDHSWATWTNHYMQVKVHGSRDTAQLIGDIVNQVGQFFEGAIYDEKSWIQEAAYADGDVNAEEIIKGIMNMGTYNSPRLLATVTPQRIVYLYPEPEGRGFTPQYMVDSNGHFFTFLGAEIPPHFCPCGGWLEIKDAIPQIARSSKLVNPSLMFIEESEYSVASGRLSITPRGIPTVWDLGGA